MSRPKHANLHLGALGTFHSGSGQDVDYVHLPAIVTSRAAGLRAVCNNEVDLRRVLTAHWEASGRRFNVDDVMSWATDFSTPMGPNEITANQRRVAVDIDWLRF